MSTLARPARGAQTVSAAVRPLTVRWAVSRRAVHNRRPDLVPSADGPGLTLQWQVRISGEGLVCGDAALIDGERTTPILSLVPALACSRHADGADHVDIPGLLAVSRDGEGRVRYARTGILGCWGVAGGRYELLDS